MSRFARIVNGIVVEFIELPEGLGPEDYFVKSVADAFIPASPFVEDHWRYKDGEFTPPDQPVSMPLAVLKNLHKSQIDTAAETERLRYITPGTGQAMTYQRKVEEAKLALADADPSAENYPLLAASVGIDGSDIAAVASVVLGMDAAWAQIGAAIEHIRLTAKKAIDDAADETTARAVVEQLAWPVVEVQP